MTKKTLALIISLSILFIKCSKKDNRIIYEVNTGTAKAILNEYKKIESSKLNNYYVIFYLDSEYKSINLVDYTFEYEVKTDKFIHKSNRFLQLDNNTFIPIIFSTDHLFEKETKRLTNRILGRIPNSVIFDIDDKFDLIQVR